MIHLKSISSLTGALEILWKFYHSGIKIIKFFKFLTLRTRNSSLSFTAGLDGGPVVLSIMHGSLAQRTFATILMVGQAGALSISKKKLLEEALLDGHRFLLIIQLKRLINENKYRTYINSM